MHVACCTQLTVMQGNLGIKGIERSCILLPLSGQVLTLLDSFLSTHTCNSICRSLRLPQVSSCFSKPPAVSAAFMTRLLQYQFGRCVEEVEEQQLHKQALVDDDRRSQSPLRWNSGGQKDVS